MCGAPAIGWMHVPIWINCYVGATCGRPKRLRRSQIERQLQQYVHITHSNILICLHI